ncbi:MAG: signal peptide peptidase SppA [Cohaesibacter sp.]|nr:signal peptide peptidase SppA [Cohaesibacter sp.]MCV6600260.1 signal peptide peptidase SppA [Cohaesibacter sp.]
MPFDADQLLERRRLSRKVTFWRIVVVVLVLTGLIALGLSFAPGGATLSKNTQHIARINFNGVILGEQRKLDLIRELKDNVSVKGVVAVINSPGGATSGGEALYDALVDLGKTKPLVASVDAMAASAGYMIALPSERIFARRSSITGSIGVLFQYTDVTKLMETVGVQMRSIKSSPLKAEPSPFSPHSPEANEMIAKMIDDSYQWFVDLVAKHRPFDRTKALELADGRVVTGGQAIDLKLIDQLGGPEAAKDWLLAKHKLSKDLELIEWKPAPLRNDLPFGLAGAFLAKWLPEPIIELFTIQKQSHKLDGLVSVWQAEKSK